MEDRYLKLPKWAQDEIRALKQDLTRTKDDLARARGERTEDDNENIFVRDILGRFDAPERPVSKYEFIEFRVGPTRHLINASYQDDGVYLSCTTGSLRVEPRSANTIVVKGIDR